MSKSILAVIFLMATTIISSYAQETTIFNQNRFLLGGGISFNFHDRDNSDLNRTDDYQRNSNHSDFSITPIIGLFSKDFVMLGIKPTLSYYSRDYFYSRSEENDIEFTDENHQKTKGLGASIFISHFYPIFKRFGAMLEHEVGYKRSNSKIYDQHVYYDQFEVITDTYEYDITRKNNEYFAGLALHLYYSLNDHVLIQTKIGELAYRHIQSTITDNRNNGEYLDTDSSSRGNLNFITNLSFDKLLTMSYIF